MLFYITRLRKTQNACLYKPLFVLGTMGQSKPSINLHLHETIVKHVLLHLSQLVYQNSRAINFQCNFFAPFCYLQYKDVCQSKQFCFLTPIHDLPSSQEDKPLKLAPLSEQRAWPTQQKTSPQQSKNIHNVNFTSSSLLFFSDNSKIIDDYI